ncbi:iron-containing alcohol dehydrogenase [Halomonas sp. EGI 63088]|uniref:Iron-containing alcohol dehydrogenase n=1 Tax=Halomonas flagellata TaxID=2920385 RepID=A0ABS9RQH6_9GAMM|nr:iron-containing alcohol dehydrogenase [Halomonas flagellata]MCH4562075.1 iron-containing alcohol dehydrogenase [Halomonas flagellata]
MTAIDNPITIHQPQQLEVGTGAAARLGAWAAGARRPLVIAGEHTAGYVDALELPGQVTVFADIPPEPDTTALDRAIAVARDCRPDLVVGLGGGSVMDIAKLVAALWDGEQTLRDVAGPNRVQGRRTTLAQVATTAGTGSEAGIRALVTDPETKSKIAVESPFLLADFAVLDPVLTYSVPPAVTAANGIDAMAHCVEAFTNIKAHDLIDGYARMGMSLIGKYLPRAVADGQDTEARAGMILASYYGGICLGPVNTAAGHALAYPLGTRLGLPHGLSNAIIFPHVLAYNVPVRLEKSREIANALGLDFDDSPESLLASAHAFCRDLGVEMRLAKHGAREQDLPGWAEEAHGIRRLMDNNPRDMTVGDALEIYRAAL